MVPNQSRRRLRAWLLLGLRGVMLVGLAASGYEQNGFNVALIGGIDNLFDRWVDELIARNPHLFDTD